jgi:rare lipoprotein A (peptidoglycan hydrolase)
VRINDRGPFVRGRSLDLSQRAAAKIGIIDEGVARLKVSKPALMHDTRLRKEYERKHWLNVAWLCAPCHGGEHPSRRNKPHHMTSHRIYRIYQSRRVLIATIPRPIQPMSGTPTGASWRAR